MIYKYFKCPKCNVVYPGTLWDRSTRQLCKTAVQVKGYRKIESAGRGERWYRCPGCLKHSGIEEIGKILKSEVIK